MKECKHFKLYSGSVQGKFCEARHTYYVRSATVEPLPQLTNLKPGAWAFVPSVTAITRLLGGDKVEGLLHWAVNETLNFLGENIEQRVVAASVDAALDKLIEPLTPALETGVVTVAQLQDALNNLGAHVGMNDGAWNALKVESRNARKLSLDKAGNIGNIVHDWLEQFIHYRMDLREKPEYPTNGIAKRAIARWEKWEGSAKPQWLLSEQKVYSKKYNFIGTLDAVCHFGGETYLIDFKTSKRVYNEHRFQTSAYQQALQEEFDITITRRMIQRLSKTNGSVTPTILEGTNEPSWQDDLAAFLGLRMVYGRLKGA